MLKSFPLMSISHPCVAVMWICCEIVNRAARPLAVSLLVVLLAGCVTQQSVNPDATPKFTAGGETILLMPIDVELFELTAGGLEDPRADWTEAAHRHVRSSLQKENARRGLRLVPFNDQGRSFEEAQELQQIVKLHQAVGLAMLAHQRIPALRLPTKKSLFDWSMGATLQPLRRGSDARYALFVYIKDSYASGGRVVMNIVTAALFGYARGGSQVGYATLVDLHTGQVAWFSSLARGTGDLRTAEAADEAIGVLLQNLPSSG